MRPEQLEAWVLSLVDKVKRGGKVEDDARVELKADWPDPRKGARRIAGHANASGADMILWVIGLDEDRGVVKTTPTDIAVWHAQVAAEFDGIAPALVTTQNVPVDSGSVTALLFDTSRKPYVVKNTVYGTRGGGAVEREVPWRQGTTIRSARREDLIRILVPLQTLPYVEVLSAHASTEHRVGNPNATGLRASPHIEWKIPLTLYVTPRTPEQLVLPVHRTLLRFQPTDTQSPVELRPHFRAPLVMGIGGATLDSHTVRTTSSEAVIFGPGRLNAQFSYIEPLRPLPEGPPLDVFLSLTPAGHDRAVEVSARLLANRVQRSPVTQGDGIDQYTRSWKSELDLAPD